MELSAMMEMVWICSVQHGIQQPHVDIEYMRDFWSHQGTEGVTQFNLNVYTHRYLGPPY
jgi:hypothetical protein